METVAYCGIFQSTDSALCLVSVLFWMCSAVHCGHVWSPTLSTIWSTSPKHTLKDCCPRFDFHLPSDLSSSVTNYSLAIDRLTGIHHRYFVTEVNFLHNLSRISRLTSVPYCLVNVVNSLWLPHTVYCQNNYVLSKSNTAGWIRNFPNVIKITKMQCLDFQILLVWFVKERSQNYSKIPQKSSR